MKIVCKDFEKNEKIPSKFTADGINVNPSFLIYDFPKETKSIVLICQDPDAKRVVGFTWIHWAVFDIPIKDNKVFIEEDSVPGVLAQNTYKKEKYMGPNPPKESGVHKYHFIFYALDTFLYLPKMTSLEILKEKMQNHILEESDYVGLYFRN